MDANDELYSLEIPYIAADEEPSDDKICPGLQRFCPHYNSEICDVKYSECVLLNSLKTSETILRLERENLIKDPSPKNLALVAEINDVLRDKNPDMHVDPAAILHNQRKGRLAAAVLFALVVIAAFMLSIGG
jgi:hypothetical protein